MRTVTGLFEAFAVLTSSHLQGSDSTWNHSEWAFKKKQKKKPWRVWRLEMWATSTPQGLAQFWYIIIFYFSTLSNLRERTNFYIISRPIRPHCFAPPPESYQFQREKFKIKKQSQFQLRKQKTSSFWFQHSKSVTFGSFFFLRSIWQLSTSHHLPVVVDMWQIMTASFISGPFNWISVFVHYGDWRSGAGLIATLWRPKSIWPCHVER